MLVLAPAPAMALPVRAAATWPAQMAVLEPAFPGVVLQAAKENPGKRIVVIVGAEHGYWLRGHLARASGVQLLDTAGLLRASTAGPVRRAAGAGVPTT